MSNPLAPMFTYTLKGNDLTKDEAVALIEATSNSPIKIELASILNLRRVDSAKLFKLSVEKQMPALASLAWKISVQNRTEEPAAKKAATKKATDTEIVSVSKSIDNLIEELHRSTALWATGAVMILSSCENDAWWTLRQIATHWVNELNVSSRSILFQGFEFSDGVWEPKEFRAGVNRRETFHVSPVYIALREAQQWLLKNDLIEREQHISRGGHGAEQSPQVSAMSRPYYTVRITDRGRDLNELWGDTEKFLIDSFNERIK